MNIVLAGTSGYIGGRLKKELFRKHKIYDYKKKIPKKADILINVAGPDRDFCKKNVRKGINERLKINRKILKIIKKNKIKKYIHLSTIHVYKKSSLINEKSDLNKKDPYSISHIKSENFINKNFKKECEYIILRVSNCFGYPSQLKSNCWKLVINSMVKEIFQKKRIEIKSKVNFIRDYIGISYLVKIIEFYLTRKLNYETINITAEKTLSILQFTKIISNILKKKFKINIKIIKNIKRHERKYKIKSSKIEKKIKNTIKYYFLKDLNELILFCKKKYIN